MLGGAMIVFATLFGSACMGRRLEATHWIGLTACTAGVVCISASSILASDVLLVAGGGKPEVAFGIALILLGQLFQALRMVLESWLLRDAHLPEHHVIGWEGAWGLLLMLGLVCPVVYAVPGYDNGHSEDLVDTGVMLANSPRLQVIVVLYVFSCVSYNIIGIRVSGIFSSLQRMMLEASRSLIVWAVTLLVHYRIDPQSEFGETWTPYSFLQMLGFVMLLVGQAIYADLLPIPCVHQAATDHGDDSDCEWFSVSDLDAWLSPLSTPKHDACTVSTK
jgi:drug/metabolite transporter (DMT)-like permease